MLSKKEFEFVESSSPITEPISKFGGQPVWINTPHWPLDPHSSKPMLFMGQIVCDSELFIGCDGMIAYIFFGDSLEPVYGEAATVVIQTSDTSLFNVYKDDKIQFLQNEKGPGIYEWDEETGEEKIYKEYRIVFSSKKEEKELPIQDRYDSSQDLDYESGYNFSMPNLAGNKLGGQALYIEGTDTIPDVYTSPEWINFLQLAPTKGYYREDYQPNFYPFHLEMGEFGILNVLVTKDFKQVVVTIQTP